MFVRILDFGYGLRVKRKEDYFYIGKRYNITKNSEKQNSEK